ncbi:4'-phosphopantetheinyl transferase superfamily protein [Paenibacillus koleovorans]|nr:4'-phosphopantetheinyl transferase superfamily protein [Paenibacillus koleovorans]
MEQIRPIDASVAKHAFTVSELRELSKLDGRLWLEQFYELWTLKESYI